MQICVCNFSFSAYYGVMGVRDRKDVLGVYDIQERSLDQKYLDRWSRVLDMDDLLEKVRAEAALPPEN